MRAHGINAFPDPDNQGHLSPARLSSAGIDIHAPGVIAAAKSCVSASEGTITKAEVEAATAQ